MKMDGQIFARTVSEGFLKPFCTVRIAAASLNKFFKESDFKMKKCIVSNDAPKPVGPYSHAVQVGNFLFVSGQLAINPMSGKIEGDDIKAQTQLVFKNIEAILKEAGFSFEDVVKVNVYLSSLEDFAKFNEVYSTIFTQNYPARTTVEAKLLPGALVEVDVIAAKE